MKNVEEFNIEDDKDDDSSKEKKPRPIIKTALDLQRLKLEKLMKNPDKPVVIPETHREKDFLHAVPSFVRNVMGSSAGAGSGEFHVYRHLRRKEYARQKHIQAKTIREQLDEDFQNKIEQNRQEAEAKTAKKRAKRQKKKLRMKQRGKKLKVDSDTQAEDGSDSDDDDEEDDKEDSETENKEEKDERTDTRENENKYDDNESASEKSDEDSAKIVDSKEDTADADDSQQQRPENCPKQTDKEQEKNDKLDS